MRGKYAGWLLLLAGGLLTFLGSRIQHSDQQLGLAISHWGAVAAGFGAVVLIFFLLIRNLRPSPTVPTYFYVSAIRADGVAIMVTGPYPSRDAAALDVARVQARSSEFDGASNSYGWGVSESSVRHEGVANKLLNFQPA